MSGGLVSFGLLLRQGVALCWKKLFRSLNFGLWLSKWAPQNFHFSTLEKAYSSPRPVISTTHLQISCLLLELPTRDDTHWSLLVWSKHYVLYFRACWIGAKDLPSVIAQWSGITSYNLWIPWWELSLPALLLQQNSRYVMIGTVKRHRWHEQTSYILLLSNSNAFHAFRGPSVLGGPVWLLLDETRQRKGAWQRTWDASLWKTSQAGTKKILDFRVPGANFCSE
jgi:hypothetical protein